MAEGDFVPNQLEKLAEIYKERNKQYGFAYKTHGAIMKSFFPHGVDLKTEDDINRFCLFNAVVGKLNRYASTFKDGGHVDSLDDASVYCQMLQEVDSEIQG